MESCIQTFLDFARPPRLECRLIELARPVERTLALIAGRARKQRVEVRFAPPSPPVLVAADEEQLGQLLVNLCLNALDAMPRGGALEIEVRAAHAPAGRGQAAQDRARRRCSAVAIALNTRS